MNPNNNDPNAPRQDDGINPVPSVEPEQTPDGAPTTPEATTAPAAPFEPSTPTAPAAPITPNASAAPVVPVTPASTTTPAASAAPGSPDPASPFTAGVPTTNPEGSKPSKFSKKTLLIAAIVGGVVLLTVIAAIIIVALTTVSKADYREAVRQYNKVNVASSALTSDVSLLGSATGSTEEDTFNERVKEVEDSIAKIKTENETLSKLKAVRVGEGSELYKTFNDKVDAYLAYGSELVTSVKNLRPALVTCDSTGGASDSATVVAALKACSSELKGISEIPNAQMKAFIDAIAENYEKYASIYEQISALNSSQYEQYQALRTQLNDAQKETTAATTTFRDDLEKRDKELSVKDSADKLGEYLTEQQK